MIGTQPTGAIEGVSITAAGPEGLRVLVNGKKGSLAILDEAGNVVSSGAPVALEAVAVSIGCYRNLWNSVGHRRVRSAPLQPAAGVDL